MLKAPKWLKDAKPTTLGWTHPVSGELLKSQRFTAEQVAEWHDDKNPPAAPVIESPVEEPSPE